MLHNTSTESRLGIQRGKLSVFRVDMPVNLTKTGNSLGIGTMLKHKLQFIYEQPFMDALEHRIVNIIRQIVVIAFDEDDTPV